MENKNPYDITTVEGRAALLMKVRKSIKLSFIIVCILIPLSLLIKSPAIILILSFMITQLILSVTSFTNLLHLNLKYEFEEFIGSIKGK